MVVFLVIVFLLHKQGGLNNIQQAIHCPSRQNESLLDERHYELRSMFFFEKVIPMALIFISYDIA